MADALKPVWVRWYVREAIEGMAALDPWEELAYRRLIDFIYATGDNLIDDDRRLGRLTKTGKRWPKIKQALIELGKIRVVNGRIHNEKCRIVLDEADAFLGQKRVAGKASAKRRWGGQIGSVGENLGKQRGLTEIQENRKRGRRPGRD